MKSEFDNTILSIADNIQRVLLFIPESIKQNAEEIRLRAGLPVCLTVEGRVMFVHSDSTVLPQLKNNGLIISQKDLNDTLSKLCNNSVYLHESEIKQGYISLSRGNRAGVCGVFNCQGMLTAIGSLNIRIARQILDCAKPLLHYAEGGLLIAGPAGSGKTTILRDLIRLLSNGQNGIYKRICVIDSRGEISGGFCEKPFNDLGCNTDILYMQNKAVGTQIALRTMFPNIIAFDEIGTNDELNSVYDCFNAGVNIITTVHCAKTSDIMHRTVTKNIIKSNAIQNIALLSHKIGTPPKIFNVKEFFQNVYS